MADLVYRAKYLNKIKPFIDKPIVKVLTGMRRVGKSTILRSICDVELAHIPSENKLFLNFESVELMHIRTAEDFMRHIKPWTMSFDGKGYLFLDEIQVVEGWETVVNGLRVDLDCDIYLTGSNTMLMSGELATYLTGRYVEFEIQSFAFSEFVQLHQSLGLSQEALFAKYLELGGLPFLKYFDLDETSSLKYISDVYNTVILRDVLQYHNVRDIDIFQRILLYAMENVGHTFSANRIKKYFKSENRTVSLDTILNYLDYCTKAFIIKRVPRYDVVGKNLLRVDEKYYLGDHGFRSAKGFSNIKDIERTLENIVYQELISRDYEVRIGRVKDKEIDFVAKKQGELAYYQVSYLLGDEKTREREFGAFSFVQDNYPKYVLSMDRLDFSRDGIRHKNIVDFLVETEAKES